MFRIVYDKTHVGSWEQQQVSGCMLFESELEQLFEIPFDKITHIELTFRQCTFADPPKTQDYVTVMLVREDESDDDEDYCYGIVTTSTE